jgi:PAS domain S-box-containing protein
LGSGVYGDRELKLAETVGNQIAGAIANTQLWNERKRAEATVRESEERYRILFDRANDGIFLISTEATIEAVNESMAHMHGYSKDEMLGMSLKDLDSPETSKLYEERMRRLLAGETLTFEVEHYHKDGHLFPLEVSASLISVRGESLIQLFQRDITERKRAEEELRASREQLRALAARLQAAREEERTHVAREIHDVLAQELTRLKIDLFWLQRHLAKPGKAAPSEVLTARVSEMSQMADAAIQCVQRIATGLRPAVLDSLGLCAAVEWLCQDFQTHSGIPCQANVPEEELPVDPESAIAAFRILQESLTNVQRHAKATRVKILLQQEARHLILRVRDNGCGIRSEALSSSLSIGLVGMRERALLRGGQLEIRSKKGSGTTVEVWMPLPKNEHQPEVES